MSQLLLLVFFIRFLSTVEDLVFSYWQSHENSLICLSPITIIYEVRLSQSFGSSVRFWVAASYCRNSAVCPHCYCRSSHTAHMGLVSPHFVLRGRLSPHTVLRGSVMWHFSNAEWARPHDLQTRCSRGCSTNSFVIGWLIN